MKKQQIAALIFSHTFFGTVGFVLGIYALPILTAPPAPTTASINAMSANPQYTTKFIRELKDSDFLHWGEGTVWLNKNSVTFIGELAAGPDYKLYLSPTWCESFGEFITSAKYR